MGLEKTGVVKSGSGLLLLIAAGMSQFIVTADYWSVAIALPRMAKDLGVEAVDLQWVITGYVLTFCAILGISGPLGDRYGRKKVLLLGIAIFAVVSIWVGFSRSASEVIISRIVLGIGGGLLFSQATAVVGESSSSDTLPRNLSLLLGIASLGSATGPVLGGLLTEALGWRWIFFANVPICVTAFVLVWRFARESRDPDAGGPLDVGGIILLLLGVFSLSLGLDRIPHWNISWWLPTTAAGLAILGVFIWFESRLTSPIVDVRLLGNRRFLGYATGGLFSNTAWCIIVFTTTLQLQNVLQFSVLGAGLFFLFLSGSVGIASVLGPVIEKRIGPRRLLALALLVQIVGSAMLWLDDSSHGMAIALFITGFGCSWGWSMSQAGSIATLPKHKVGLASGSVLTIIILSGNIGVVGAATVIDMSAGQHGGDYAVGVTHAYLLGGICAVLGLVVSITILATRRKHSPQPH